MKKRIGLVVFLVLAGAGGWFFVSSRGIDDFSPEKSAWLTKTAAIEKRVKSNGHSLRVLEVGRGPPILLLHGWNDSTFTWRGILPRLSKDHHLVAFDWPGSGYSEKPDRPLGFPELARTAVDVMDALGIERAFVAGNSMGGAAAIQLAVDFPGRLYGVVVLDPALATDRRRGASRFLLKKVIGDIGAFVQGRRLLRSALKDGVYNDDLVTDEVLEEMYLPLTTPGGRRAMLAQTREIFQHPIAWETAGRVRLPALIIWGREDRWLPLVFGRMLHRQMPGSRLEVLDGVGHMPQWEDPENVARLIRGFVREVGAPLGL
jgi:pimeloyl-ACP methyl ester carboxylesterase